MILRAGMKPENKIETQVDMGRTWEELLGVISKMLQPHLPMTSQYTQLLSAKSFK